jgi:hypothetical protein
MIDIHGFQGELLRVKIRHFDDAAIHSAPSRALNVAEEAGELAREERLVLDGRPLREDLARDAVGDTFIALCGYCIARGWELDEIVYETWATLRARWESGQLVGMPPGDEP